MCVCVCVFVSPVAYFHYTTPNIDELYIYNNKINNNNNIVYPQYVIIFFAVEESNGRVAIMEVEAECNGMKCP